MVVLGCGSVTSVLLLRRENDDLAVQKTRFCAARRKFCTADCARCRGANPGNGLQNPNKNKNKTRGANPGNETKFCSAGPKKKQRRLGSMLSPKPPLCPSSPQSLSLVKAQKILHCRKSRFGVTWVNRYLGVRCVDLLLRCSCRWCCQFFFSTSSSTSSHWHSCC